MDGPVCSRLALLWYSGPSSALGWSFFQESSFSLFLSPFFFFSLSLAIPQFGLLSHSLRLSSGHSGPVLTLSSVACTSLFSPCLLVADASIWPTSLLGVLVRHIICGVCVCVCVFFSLPVMLPSEIPKLPTDLLVRGFPGVWKLLLHNSLPGMGRHPQLFCLSF